MIGTQEMMPKECPIGKKKRTSVKKPSREAPVLKACLQWLAARGVFCWRNNSGAVEFVGGRFMRFGLTGSADILGMLPTGRFLAVECKSATGKQSDSQREFQKRTEANGGLYLLVHSLGELEIELRKENHLNPLIIPID